MLQHKNKQILKTSRILPFLWLVLPACKKETGPLQSSYITWYHEVDGKIVSEVYIPSAFTPGHDGINDLYRPRARGCTHEGYRLTIYDTYGHELFTANNINAGWDGKTNQTDVPAGVYVYRFTLSDTTGYVYEAGHSFHLLR